MPRPLSCALALGLLPLLACGGPKEDSPAKPAAAASQASTPPSWACPDTGLRWFTYADSSNADRPWHPPASMQQDPKATPRILPGLHLNYQYRDQAGTVQVASQELIEPNLSWVEDVNSDGLADLAIHDGTRETRPTWVLLNCGRDRYSVAFESMAEGVALEAHPDPDSQWQALRVHWWYVQGEHQQNMILHWDGSKFAKACEYRIAADSLGLPRRGGCP